jgi:hypothetical protein
MKKIVLTYGFIAGAILAVTFAATVPLLHSGTSGHSDVIGYAIGYTSMVLAFLLVYFGIRSYRDTVGSGTVTFGRAVAVGSLIALIASCCYVASWEVMYYKFMPDFAEKYAAQKIERARASGASEAALAEQRAKMEQFVRSYHNPVKNVAYTFLEPLPVALVMVFVSAGFLRRRRRGGAMPGGATSAAG